MPLYLVILGFQASAAVALSNVSILGGTLVNMFFNVQRRHPTWDAPLINWDLILVMEPSTIMGAIAGGTINHVSCIITPHIGDLIHQVPTSNLSLNSHP